LSGKLSCHPVAPCGAPERSATFVEFEQLDGGRMYLAKTALHSVTPSNIRRRPI
jgi:hypothetical protein